MHGHGVTKCPGSDSAPDVTAESAVTRVGSHTERRRCETAARKNAWPSRSRLARVWCAPVMCLGHRARSGAPACWGYRIGSITSRNLGTGGGESSEATTARPVRAARPLRGAAGLLLAAGGTDLHAARASCCLLLFANADELGRHREECLLNVRGRLGARLQERDAQRVGVILRCLARDLRATAA